MTESTTINKEQKIRFNTGLLKNKDGSTFLPTIKSINEQIKDNSELIRKLRQEMIKHPEAKVSLSVALDSTVTHQIRLLDIFAMEKGISDYVAMAVDTVANKLVRISSRKLTSLVDAAEDLMRSCLASYKRQNKRRNIDFSLDFCLPFESSFGYFLLPQAIHTSKKQNPSQVLMLNSLVKDAVIDPFYEILSKSSDETTLQRLFNKWGSDVANEYEKYIRIISEQDISLSIYSENRAFYTNKKFADSVLNKMMTSIEVPQQEIFSAKICGIVTYAGNRQAIFARDGGRRIDASFPEGLEDKILQLYDRQVEATFNHKIEKKAVSGKIDEEWELLMIEEIKK